MAKSTKTKEPEKAAEPEQVKTTLTLDAELWQAIRIKAIEEKRGYRALVADALRLYLDMGTRRGSHRPGYYWNGSAWLPLETKKGRG